MSNPTHSTASFTLSMIFSTFCLIFPTAWSARPSFFDGWHVDGGIGFRLVWNLATTVSFDYGISSEGQLFTMDLGYAF